MFSSQVRISKFARLRGEEFDVVVIGGGIIGAGIARDAALRGLRVALFEKRDFGSGTTAGSTRLIHGGLRYLEMLDFRLVRMDLRERETLLRIAPHLVRPLEFVMPFYRNTSFYRWKMRIGMTLYDLLSFDKSLPNHRSLSRDELLEIEPALRREGLQGAMLYYDAQANSPERLCIENIIDAAEYKAQSFNYADVVGAVREDGEICGVRVRDLLCESGEEFEVKARVIVNASGAWFDGVAGALTHQPANSIRTTKGIHLTCPPLTRRAIVLFSPLDNRLMFVIPWLGFGWLGTTDTDFTGDPATAHATQDDAAYTIKSVAHYFPAFDTDKIYYSNAGVRALVKKNGSESSVSRMHRIVNGKESGARNLISVMGGKLTGYRQIAEDATDAVCLKLNHSAACQTAQLPLPGARGKNLPTDVERTATNAGLTSETVEHLFNLYGTCATHVINLAASDVNLCERLSPYTHDIAAQALYAVRHEQCSRLIDFLLRRTLLGFSEDQGQSAAPHVASLLAQELDWSSERTAIEMLEYQSHIAITQAFRNGEATTKQNAANEQRAVIERVSPLVAQVK
ncbi:MAG: glycerol-3-phosphate dehydrogenase/oxidase [Pyrinomonadaceae bacterium MAG19_C2-C3]|nr:glycerol-3-phosphate dehydrogenase/oxidase [Pyrinomonadaceae bacterium MAG19_C2-C3]